MKIRRYKSLTQGTLITGLWILSLTQLIPIWLMIIGSLKSKQEAALPSLALPTEWHFENYITVFQKGKIAQALYNSIFISGSAVIAAILLASAAAFYLARIQTKWSKLIYNTISLGLIAPVSIIPTIRLFQVLHINNTYLSVILLFSAIHLPLCVFLITGFIKTIPRELDEASIIDGCSSLQLFIRIILPLLTPVILTGAVIAFMGVWNSFVIPLYFLNNSSKWTLPLTVYNFFGQYSQNWNLVFADLVITALPVAIFYLIAQKYIISGLTAGAVKG
jgi:raffinose/stachyose/melibiose transport system permease protein